MSGHEPISVFLADVDGTLVTHDKILTDKAIAAAKALRDAGITLALTSGRPPRGMAMFVKPLDLQGMIAGFNGGVFVDPELKVLETHTLDPKDAREAVDLCHEQGLDAWLYTDTEWLLLKKDAPHVDREAWTVKFDPVVVQSYTDAQYAKAVKVVGISDDHAKVAQAEKAAQDAFGDRVSAARSQPYYLDVTHKLANKGAVVDMLARKLNVPAGQIATIGDMPNDVLMFRRSGFSIAMGNASDEVKAQASAVTSGYDDEGFARAVHDLILPRAAR